MLCRVVGTPKEELDRRLEEQPRQAPRIPSKSSSNERPAVSKVQVATEVQDKNNLPIRPSAPTV